MAGITNPFVDESEFQETSSGVITNIQNDDKFAKQNMSVEEEHTNWLQKIVEEYEAGEITEESIRAACERQNPPIDPTPILDFCQSDNLHREMNPYFKSDLRDVPTTGYDYNGTLGDGESITVAGCEITATTYRGNDVEDTENVFGLEALKADKVYDALMDRSVMNYASEFLFKTSVSDGIDEDDYYPEERTIYHCHSDYLGDFDYDPTMYRIGYKEIEEKDGSTSQLPVLEYIGPSRLDNVWVTSPDSNDGFEAVASMAHDGVIDDAEEVVDNMIPLGCKVLDYTFCTPTGVSINYAPRIPEGVTSMNYTFAGCNLDIFPDRNIADKLYGNDESTKVYVLPSTLECAQGTFENCDNMRGDFVMRNPEYMQRDEVRSRFYSSMMTGNLMGFFARSTRVDREIDDEDAYLDQLPSSVVNIVDMFSGCDSLDEAHTQGRRTDIISWLAMNPGYNIGNIMRGETSEVVFDRANFGGELTPYLTPELMRGVYDDIQDSTAMLHDADATDGYFKDDSRESVITDSSGINSDYDVSGLDEEKIDASRAAQMILTEGKVDSGYVDTSVEVASDGQRTNNKIKDADGSTYYDATGHKVSYQDMMADTSQWWEKWSQAGAIGLVAGVVGGVVTKNKWVGLAMGVGGGFIASKFVPSTLYPVVHATAQLFHSEKLEEWAQKLPGAESYIANKEIRDFNRNLDEYNEQWDNNYNLGFENYDSRISRIFGEVTAQGSTSMLVETDCSLSMRNNGFAAAQELNFAGVASMGEDNAKCVVDTMQEAISTANANFNSRFADGADLDEKSADEMRDYYLFLMKSAEAYSSGAVKGIETFDSGAKADVQMDGLGMVNRAYVETVMTNLKELDSQYHFMTDEVWEQMSHLEIEGVDMEHISAFDNSYFIEERNYMAGKTVEDIRALAEVDSDFRIAMGEEMNNLDARVPEGWVSREAGAETPTAGSYEEGVTLTEDTQSIMNSAVNPQSESYTQETHENRVDTVDKEFGDIEGVAENASGFSEDTVD